MADLEDHLTAIGLDQTSIDIYMGSWRPATKKQYNGYLEKWTCFCVENSVSPRKPTVFQIMRFLTWLVVVKKLSYSAVNSARSALSAYVHRFGFFTAGSHPEITRHMKGISNKIPPQPKPKITWDVNTVFILLKS